MVLHKYMTTYQVAEQFQISEATLREWRTRENDPGPPWIKIGACVRYPVDGIVEWLSARGTKGGK